MVSNFVREPEDLRAAQRAMAVKRRANLDWIGIALLSIGLAALQYVLEEGNRNDWFDSRLISGLSLVSFIAIATFIVRELTAKVPAVDIMLFKDSVFTAGTVVGGVMFALLMSVTFLLPVFLQEVLGYTATQSGLALMPRALIMMVVTPIVGRTYNIPFAAVGGQLRCDLCSGQHLDDEPLHPGHVREWNCRRAAGAGPGF
jgi:DHA2 family multidrug resistance protein